MHHVGSTLGLVRFAMSAYKRGKVRQIFHFHKNCYAHTKVDILALKTITHHQGLLSACALLLTKAGVAFITDKPAGRSREFPAPCTWANSATNSQDVMNVICGSWFMILVILLHSNQPLPRHSLKTDSALKHFCMKRSSVPYHTLELLYSISIKHVSRRLV